MNTFLRTSFIFCGLTLIGDWLRGISITGNVNPEIGLIGTDVTLSCQIRGCTPSSLHLYKWESSQNTTLYIYNGTKQNQVQENREVDRHEDGSYRGWYKNRNLRMILPRVQLANTGQYVCAMTCDSVYKEVILDVIVEDVINAAVGEDVILSCPLIMRHDPSHLKMQWKRINPRKSENLYSYLFQNTCPVIYSKDSLGDWCSSDRTKRRIMFGNKYKQKTEVFKGNEFRNRNAYLKLNNIQKEDAGKYICSMRSQLLHRQVVFQLLVTEFSAQDTEIWMLHCVTLLDALFLCLVALHVVKRNGKVSAEPGKVNAEASELQELQEHKGQQQEDMDHNKEACQMEILLLKEELYKLRREIKWRRARNNADNIILDVDSAHPNLSTAVDKKSFIHNDRPRSVEPNPQRFDGTVSILASEGFSSGSHYWEVEINDSTEWDLGVVRRSIKRKGQTFLSPKEGSWVLGMIKDEYWAKTNPWIRVIVQRKPSKIGVYLSFQKKEVTFFNVADTSVLFVFENCSFSEVVLPFFKSAQKGTTMRICSLKEDA